MSNLDQAIELEILAQQAPITNPNRSRSADQVVDAIFTEAASQGRPFKKLKKKDLLKRWIASKRFHLMRIPIAAAALTCKPADQAWAQTRIYAESGQESVNRPITVDVNKPGVGRTEGGFTPPVIVIDGKHRFYGAAQRGASHIWAWVGELAAERLNSRKPIKVDPKLFRGALQKGATRIDVVAQLHGNGDGQNVEGIDAILARELGADPTAMRRMVTQYKQTKGRYKVGGTIRAVSPPGWSGTVEKMKGHPEVENPHAMAWWMHDQGYRPNGKGK
jgi:hypothetical protein